VPTRSYIIFRPRITARSPTQEGVDMRPVHIMDTTLRDAHQSLWATRMEVADMLPILRQDGLGRLLVARGLGRRDVRLCLRFLDENPWERLRVIKKHCPITPLQMLLRGQNLVGYRHYSDEIVTRFVLASKRNGIDVFRVFDALNDIRNVEVTSGRRSRSAAATSRAPSATP
jgi:oxaloacetate decarboxylase (Na+ extruding) subunit alpha